MSPKTQHIPVNSARHHPVTAPIFQFLRLALIALAIPAMFACSSNRGEDLDMPPHDESEQFLRYQEWLNTERPAPSSGYQHSPKNQRRFGDLQRQQKLSQSRMDYRSREQEKYTARSRVKHQQNWDNVQTRLSAEQARDMKMERMIQDNIAAGQVKDNRRFNNYQGRVEELDAKKKRDDQTREINAAIALKDRTGTLEEVEAPSTDATAEETPPAQN